MAIVPDYGGPQVAPVVGAGTQGASFQAMQAPAADVVTPFEKAVNKIGSMQAKLAEETDEAIATEAETEAIRHFDNLLMDPKSGFLSLRGKNALQPDRDGVSPMDAMMKNADSFVQGILDGKNKDQQLKIKAKLAPRLNSLYGRGMQHAMSENHAYMVSTYEGKWKQATQSAFTYFDSPDVIKRAIKDAELAAVSLAKLTGKDVSGLKKSAVANVHKMAALGFLANAEQDPSLYAVGSTYIEKNAKQMAPEDIVQLKGRMYEGQKNFSSDLVAESVYFGLKPEPTKVQIIAGAVAPQDPEAGNKYTALLSETGDAQTAAAMLVTSKEAVAAAKENAKAKGNENNWVAELSAGDQKKVSDAIASIEKVKEEQKVFDETGKQIDNAFDSRYAERSFRMPSEEQIRAAVQADPFFGNDHAWVEKTVNSVRQRFESLKRDYVQRHATAMDNVCLAYASGAKPREEDLSQLTVKELLAAQDFRKRVIAEDNTGDRKYAAFLSVNKDVLSKMTEAQMRNALRSCPRGTHQGLWKAWETEQQKKQQMQSNAAAVARGEQVFGKTHVTTNFVLSALNKLDADFKDLDSDAKVLIASEVAMAASEDAAFGFSTKDENQAYDYVLDFYKKSFVATKFFGLSKRQKSILSMATGDMPSQVKNVATVLAKQFYGREDVSKGQIVSAAIRLMTRRSMGVGNMDFSQILGGDRKNEVRSHLRSTINTERRQMGLPVLKTQKEIDAEVEKLMQNDQVVLRNWMKWKINGDF